MESWSWADCCQSGVNLATPIYVDKLRLKLDDDEIQLSEITYHNWHSIVIIVNIYCLI